MGSLQEDVSRDRRTLQEDVSRDRRTQPMAEEDAPVPENPFCEIEMYLQRAKEDILAALQTSSSSFASHPDARDSVISLADAYSPPVRRAKHYKRTRYKFESPPPERLGSPLPKEESLEASDVSTRSLSREASDLREWSLGLLKEFQSVVEDELIALGDRASHKDQSLSNEEDSLSAEDDEDGSSKKERFHPKKSPYDLTHFESPPAATMGASQSTSEEPFPWLEVPSHVKTCTLPRRAQRSISFLAEKFSHTSDPEDNCKLLKLTQRPFSRSYSVDDGRRLSPWALQQLKLIDGVHEGHCLPQELRTSGASSSDAVDNERISNGWVSADKTLEAVGVSADRTLEAVGVSADRTLEAVGVSADRTVEAVGVSADRTVEAVGVSADRTLEAVGQKDDDQPFSSESIPSDPVLESKDDTVEFKENQLKFGPEIIVTGVARDHQEDRTSGNYTKFIKMLEEKASFQSNKIMEQNGHKSEPTLPCTLEALSSPLLDIPGLEMRRHTFPDSLDSDGTKSISSLEVPGTPVFSTLSWETLPPAEEMEVMEEKPILQKNEQLINRSRSESLIRSLSSSLSSLSQVSTRGEFSECEIPPHSSDLAAKNEVEPVIERGNFSPDVFLDPSKIPVSEVASEGRQTEGLKDVFVDTTPVMIKLSPMIVRGDSIIPETFTLVDKDHKDKIELLSKLVQKSHSSGEVDVRLKSLALENDKRSLESNLIKFLPESLEALVSVGRSKNENFSVSEPKLLSEDCKSVLDKRKPSRIPKYPQGTKSWLNSCVRPPITEADRPDTQEMSLRPKNASVSEGSGFGFSPSSPSEGSSDKDFLDFGMFVKEVENRIPSQLQSLGVTFSEAATQTSPLVLSPCGSHTSTSNWLSDCTCDAVSLEPCPSTPGTDEDLDEEDADDWWKADGSLSSSPPITPSSPTRDDSSPSLSESLEHLEPTGEAGIGTISTGPSFGPLNLYGSGLDTSFERRVRRYTPNSRVSARSRIYHSPHWVKRENQMTQTSLSQPQSNHWVNRNLRASSEEAQSTCKTLAGEKAKAVHHTYSEPKLATPFPQPLLGAPDLSSSFSFCGAFLLPPTISEDRTLMNGMQERPRYLPVGDIRAPKSISAPALEKKLSPSSFRVMHLITPEEPVEEIKFPPQRTQSAKEISEVEALEACIWLRAAGFPQYAQMYEDCQFPLELISVERDHSFLDVDSLQALFRRLRVLNRCAKIRLDHSNRCNADDSDEEEQRALSGNWEFERHSKRWSRVDPTSNVQLPARKGPAELRASGSDLVLVSSEGSDEVALGHFKRSGSERIKDGAKALLRRMESLKYRKKKRHSDGMVIGSPKVQDDSFMQVRMAELGCVDISPEDSPRGRERSPSFLKEDTSSQASDQSQSSTPRFRSRRKKRFWRKGVSTDQVLGVAGAYSDSECSPPPWRYCHSVDSNSNVKMLPIFRNDASPGADHSNRTGRPVLRHATSLTYGRKSQHARDHFMSSLRDAANPVTMTTAVSVDRNSIYDNVPLIICNRSYQEYQSEAPSVDSFVPEGSGSSECTMESRESPPPPSQREEAKAMRRATLDRWHSFNRRSQSSLELVSKHLGAQIYGFSVGQMNHLRQMALLRLTALMDRHSPSNRTAWNWELPKFLRKMKVPDYKERSIFGVPLQVISQRGGQPLPSGIQLALHYLKSHCIDQVGLFRKPGVRSRIQKLRELHELEEDIEYSEFGHCDIADMVKTYFRELPEVLLTNKLSDIFIVICQSLPPDVRLEALQCAMFLMPDENREVLMTLLSFLSDVAANSHINQMTASNLAVCLAPSLFRLNISGSGSSPLRRKSGGTPEQKDLHENRAAHQCLTLMIQEVSHLHSVNLDMLANCRFSYLDLSQPVSLDDLGSASNISLGSCNADGDWSTYMNACIVSLMKETKEKGWIHISSPDPRVEVGYRKVGDGHPLRLWRVITEVEAPPSELLTRVLRERHLWDETLLKWRVVTRLSKQAEVFQYLCNSKLPPRPHVDYCVLRYWRADLDRGICVVVETSVNHPDATPVAGAIRGVVLASRYMIQPCGSGKSRITHISRVDMRGRLPEWYNKNFAHFAACHLSKLRQSFEHHTVGPESKV